MSIKAQAIDFEEARVDGAPIIPLPNDTDTLQETARKLQSYAEIINGGKSLAIHTGFKATPHSERDPTKLAIERMTISEQDAYAVWSEGINLTPFNWEKNKEALPTGKDSAKRFAQRAAAMNTAWKTNEATPENAAWLTSHMPDILPLLKALVRVETAKMDLRGGIPGQDASELAEYQTINKIRSLAVQAEEKQMKVIRQLEADILRDMRTLKERADSLELRKPSGREKVEVKLERDDASTA